MLHYKACARLAVSPWGRRQMNHAPILQASLITLLDDRKIFPCLIESGSLGTGSTCTVLQVLQRLCDKLRFDGEAAAALHKSLYRQKLESILEPKKASVTSLSLASGQNITGVRVCLCCLMIVYAAVAPELGCQGYSELYRCLLPALSAFGMAKWT